MKQPVPPLLESSTMSTESPRIGRLGHLSSELTSHSTAGCFFLCYIPSHLFRVLLYSETFLQWSSRDLAILDRWLLSPVTLQPGPGVVVMIKRQLPLTVTTIDRLGFTVVFNWLVFPVSKDHDALAYLVSLNQSDSSTCM